MDLSNLIDARELAILIWLAVALPLLLRWKPGRGIIGGLWKTFAGATKLYQLFALAGVYVILEVLALWGLGYWGLGHLKSTVLWAVTAPTFAMYRLYQASDDYAYFRQALADAFKVTIAIEFLVEFYPFNIWIELVIIPLTFILPLLAYSASKSEETKWLERAFEWGLAIIGFVALFHAVRMVFAHFETFATVSTLITFVLPLVLFAGFLPFLYALAIQKNYERAFVRVKYSLKDPQLARFAKVRSALTFGPRINLLRRWTRDLNALEPKTREDVRQSIRATFDNQHRAQTDKPIPESEGWSPYKAKDFLLADGLKTDDYHVLIGETDRWWAGTSYLEIGSGILPNNISYYVDGDKEAVKQLKLVLNVNERNQAAEAHEKLSHLTVKLIELALGCEVPPNAHNALKYGEPINAELRGKVLSIERQEFPNGSGYTIKVVLKVPGFDLGF